GEPQRRGKWLLAPTDAGPVLILHFGMTGELVWSLDGARGAAQPHPHDRLLLGFERGRPAYPNMRKFGGARPAADANAERAEEREVVGELGPDALGLGRRAFHQRLVGRRGAIKALLMDQSFVAGVGNIISDEVLWQARLHPLARVEDLSGTERDRLFEGLQRV